MNSDPHPSCASLAIIIPTWNGAAFLRPCLDALDSEIKAFLVEYPDCALRCRVVDNGSSDDSLEILEQYPWVEVIRFEENRGFAAAVNAGILAGEEEVLVLLNNDTEVQAAWLVSLVRALLRSEDIGMVSSKVLVMDEPTRIHTTGDWVDLAGRAGNRGFWEHDDGQWDAATEVFGANAAAAAYRREMFMEVGLFEEAFGSYMEDVDLSWRAQLAGWRGTFAPKARVLHKVSATGGGAYASFHVARNRIWVIARNYPLALLLPNLHKVLWVLVGEAWRAIRAIRGEAARATLRGLAVGIISWPLQLPARIRIQSNRDRSLASLRGLLQPAERNQV